jgi:predicted nucleic acid-binding protein
MIYSNFLAEDMTPLILDTSVLINLHASMHGGRILCCLPNDILVPEIVASELEHETSKNNGEHQFMQDLAANCKVRLVALDEREYEIFESLVSGSPSLDDGEAATIATAACRSCLPVIDERKGRLQAQEYIPDKQLGWSLDLFRHPKVVAELGAALSVEALYFALRDGRMRIHESHCDHVVSLIGVQRALDCKSLPGYKVRRQQWQELLKLKN